MIGQRRCRHISLHPDRHADTATANAPQLFGESYLITIIQTHTTKSLWLGNTQKAQIAHFFKQLVSGKTSLRLPFIRVRIDFPVDKLRRGVGNGTVLFGK